MRLAILLLLLSLVASAGSCAALHSAPSMLFPWSSSQPSQAIDAAQLSGAVAAQLRADINAAPNVSRNEPHTGDYAAYQSGGALDAVIIVVVSMLAAVALRALALFLFGSPGKRNAKPATHGILP